MDSLEHLLTDLWLRLSGANETASAASAWGCIMWSIIRNPILQLAVMPSGLCRRRLGILGFLLSHLWNWLTDKIEVLDSTPIWRIIMRRVLPVAGMQCFQLPRELCRRLLDWLELLLFDLRVGHTKQRQSAGATAAWRNTMRSVKSVSSM